ncbi:PspC domain-containing protein [Telluribacter sp. SYSU D00476]|uniref:PspC domain-containing protein n=1 Tax=Telluribacter sp. SYSU D00476 TaxID=2811430 RepID=UPI001FF34BC4|nr:PspC domain-containing protein [Telluribacter sp. SYSU D00476]
MEKKLRRIPGEAVLGGVAAGVADYFGVDKAIIRVLFVLALLLPPHAGWIIIAYIILWVALPEGDTTTTTFTGTGTGTTGTTTGETTGGIPGNASRPYSVFDSPSGKPGQSAKILGFGLVAVGVVLLIDELPIWYSIRHYFWPAALIGIGAYLLLRQRDEESMRDHHEPIITPPPAEPFDPVVPTPAPTPTPPPSSATSDRTWPTDPNVNRDKGPGDDEPTIRVN